MLKEKYGEWALITGASSGIGEAFAEELAGRGINLVIVARRIERLNKLSNKLQHTFNIKVISIELDLTTSNFLSLLEEKLKGIEVGILINNAGAGLNGEFKDFNSDEITKVISLNCIVPTLLTNYLLEKMVLKRKGAIIFLASTVGLNPSPFMSVYSASKAYNYSLGSSLWYELKRFNIDVLVLAPGSTDTEFPRLNKSTSFSAKPEDVVKTALDSLGKKVYVVDGFINKLFIQFSKIFPKKIILKLTGYFSEKLWKKNYRNRSL